jgi:hypothetical protein
VTTLNHRQPYTTPRNLTSTTATPQKQHQKSQQKIEKTTTIKEGIKTLQ